MNSKLRVGFFANDFRGRKDKDKAVSVFLNNALVTFNSCSTIKIQQLQLCLTLFGRSIFWKLKLLKPCNPFLTGDDFGLF